MTGLASWQRAVYYLGTVLMLGGFGWAVYRMLVLRGCPTARFNDLSLIVLGLGVSILPLHPFGAAPGYFVPVMRRMRGMAVALWVLGLVGAAYAVYALWHRIPNLQWMPALLPAAVYMWFGIDSGKPGAAPRPGAIPVGRTAASAISPVDRDVRATEEHSRAGTPVHPLSAPPEADTAVGPTEDQERRDA